LNFKKLKYEGKRPYEGHQVSATTHSAPVRSSAARAALDLTGAERPKANTPKNKAGRPFGLPAFSYLP
ncbi:hypothetical protein ABI582_20770, partial [Pseudomonas sp. SAS7]|uniref:hypothetical protein n=1 Tax=Pseudomonas sp. SAS7 TaxID=3156487 RepID=UPI003F99341F